jgi:hypothetical protein
MVVFYKEENEYDNEIFWDELSDRLAMRDLFHEEGEEKVKIKN